VNRILLVGGSSLAAISTVVAVVGIVTDNTTGWRLGATGILLATAMMPWLVTRTPCP